MLEATIGARGGQSSQCFKWRRSTSTTFYINKSGTDYIIHNTDTTKIKGITATSCRESVSALAAIRIALTNVPNPDFVDFGVNGNPTSREMERGVDGEMDAYVTWYIDGEPTWTLKAVR